MRRFEFRAQPIVDLATGRVVAAEAFLRLFHGRQQVPVPRWLPESAASGALTNHMITQLSEGELANDSPDVRISINVFGRDLLDERFVAALESSAATQRLAIEVSHLEFDLAAARASAPEYGWVEVPDLAERLLLVREAGVEVWLDDLGEFEVAVDLLAMQTFDLIKLDRSLLHRPLGELSSLVDTAHGQGHCVLIEGIESNDEHRRAREAGIELGQGFWFGAPVPLAEFTASTDGPFRSRGRRSP